MSQVNPKVSPEGFTDEDFVQAIAETLAEKITVMNALSHQETEVMATSTYVRHSPVILTRKIISVACVIFLIYAIINIFELLSIEFSLNVGFVCSVLTISSGLGLIICLVSEVFRGAGLDVEMQIKQGTKQFKEYHFIPSLNRFPFVLLLLALGFLTIILGFASFYTELLRQNPHHFSGIQDGFLAIYFSIVTFSTVGYGDIHPASFAARVTAICEIFIAMFFSLVVISTTLSWVIAHKRQEQEIAIKKRIQAHKKQPD
ncbi:potassium channel family protein [Spirulina sp. CS-785/01]|uniref:potassium channel family protein n=1 Tax=Spirulina sp. CS-785/01 TaxID=3021716 RepID=UPI00232DB83D|nr:potassium channel family protein [Spirulina sp. CS-785/01]MDB9313975.1 potassium channel family protein [Spirulina sp. CS-785/01]